MMDGCKEGHYNVDKDETRLTVVMVFMGDDGDGQKTSPKVHRNFGDRCTELEVAARKKEFRSGTSASRRRLAYI